ncbi:MAG: hypothetical protein RLY78_1978 [Pseudomonadota bacterium]|jgi:putative ABC transport system permease protein
MTERLRALLRLAAASAWYRRGTLALVTLAIALATLLQLGIEQLRRDVRLHFSSAVSGTDLIVGARTGATQLMLYSVFRIGQATQNMRWASVQAIAQDRAVAWVVPIALGDSLRGHPVVGTTADYFRHFRYGDDQALALREGRVFAHWSEAVLGADVAEALGLRVGAPLVLSHGMAAGLPGAEHADRPFTVVGVLARTGTPVDRSVHIGLDGMAALHVDWMAGVPLPGQSTPAADLQAEDLAPTQVTAVLVGLKSRAAVFSAQRRIQALREEPLVAVLPGVTLDELWAVVGVGERLLQAVAALVGVVSLAGLSATVLTGLEQRRRELAVLRAVGASPRTLAALLLCEGLWLATVGVAVGAAAGWVLLQGLGPWLARHHGLVLGRAELADGALPALAAVWLAALLASLLPAWRAWRLSLADGLAPPP